MTNRFSFPGTKGVLGGGTLSFETEKVLASWDEFTLCGKWGWMGLEAVPYYPGKKGSASLVPWGIPSRNAAFQSPGYVNPGMAPGGMRSCLFFLVLSFPPHWVNLW